MVWLLLFVEVVQVDDLWPVEWLGVVLDELHAGFEVFHNSGFAEQHDPLRLAVLERRREEGACGAGLNHVAHGLDFGPYAALAWAAGLIASSVNFVVFSAPATMSNSHSHITPPRGQEFLR